MCGRFVLTTPAEALVELLGLDEPPALSPRYNIAPTQPVLVALPGTAPSHRMLRAMRWGLVPAWSKEPATRAPMINARAEGLADRPAFREPFRRRRCLIPADGFYEWKRRGRSRQPFLIRRRDRRPFCFAGLWDRWARPDRPPIESCTIVTTAPNRVVAALHDRMPAILPPSSYEGWLGTDGEPLARAAALLRPLPDDELEAYPVSTVVNNAAHDGPECIAPAPHNTSLLL